MNVLSLFDGMSCGQQALTRSGFKIDNYFASEIDKYAITVTMANFPETKQLGSVVNVNGYDLPKIDLLIGGSPCQSFSFAGKRKGMSTKCETEILTLEHYLELKNQGFEFEGQSYLFWEFMRLLNETKPKYFLLENVEMGERWEKVLSRAIGVNGIHINSALLCAQNRKRIYWTNIGMKPAGLFGDLESIIEQPKDKGILLKDILENEVSEKYFFSKKMIESFNIKTKHYKDLGGGFCFKPSEGNNKGRTLTNPAKNRMDDNYIIHNMQPRSGDPKKGGNGHLTRTDGKTYCLDTGNTNAVEIVPMDFRYDEGFRERLNGKSPTLCLGSENGISGNALAKINSRIRRLTPIECERLQTVNDNYTNHVSDSQRYKMLGNGWTVDVISHIFNYMK
jgi:DNA (cytosine-5)-methyltransferase 3A